MRSVMFCAKCGGTNGLPGKTASVGRLVACRAQDYGLHPRPRTPATTGGGSNIYRASRFRCTLSSCHRRANVSTVLPRGVARSHSGFIRLNSNQLIDELFKEKRK